MQIYSEIRNLLIEELRYLGREGLIPVDIPSDSVTLERPKDTHHGELATNAALVIARQARCNPRYLAGLLSDRLSRNTLISKIEIAGPGFVNIFLEPNVWNLIVTTALEEGRNFGRSQFGLGQNVNLEFVSANPTGPLHIGHTRGAVFGDALARLLEFTGYKVVREYYVNDGGAQVDTLARSAYLRYLEANGQKIDFESNSYSGDYLVSVGEVIKEEFGSDLIGKPESVWIDQVREIALAHMLELIRKDLKSLGIEMDNYFFERSLNKRGLIADAIDRLEQRGLIYKGVLQPPKGKISSEWEPREQILFRSTLHGDDTDRPIMKADGSWTYFAPDIAYHFDKINRGYDKLINIFGSDHSGYCKRLKAVVSALSDDTTEFDIKLIQLVNVVSGDAVQKMSKRAGNFVRLREAVDAVGADVTRFVMLMRRNDAPLDFNFVKVREQSRDNPVFYVQYAHARVCSLTRRASDSGLDVNDDSLLLTKLPMLEHPVQLQFMQKIAEWPRVIELASRHHEPHRIVFYLTELASEFHALWNLGGEIPSLRILQPNDSEGTRARIALARAAAIVINVGLGILGVTPVREM